MVDAIDAAESGKTFDITAFLQPGSNVLLVSAVDPTDTMTGYTMGRSWEKVKGGK